jgi:hypothetical protein
VCVCVLQIAVKVVTLKTKEHINNNIPS